jgi:hypothetical protein
VSLRRPLILLAILAALVVFVLVSAILARVFSIDGAERGALTSLVQAEGRGDAAAMIRLMYRCDAACRARVSLDASRLRRAGQVGIAEINPSAGFALGSTIGTARVAWYAADPRPVVQCVRVRRAGSALSGFHVELLELSLRIKSDRDCPKRY